MGLLSSLFKTPKIVDAAINSGDALVFTDEEKKEWLLKAWEVTAPQNLARRYIALATTGVWAVETLTLFGIICHTVLSKLDTDLGPLISFYITSTAAFGVVVQWYFWKRIKNGD